MIPHSFITRDIELMAILSVRLSVHPLRSGILWKQLKILLSLDLANDTR